MWCFKSLQIQKLSIEIYNNDKIINIKVNSVHLIRKILQLEFTGKYTNIGMKNYFKL